MFVKYGTLLVKALYQFGVFDGAFLTLSNDSFSFSFSVPLPRGFLVCLFADAQVLHYLCGYTLHAGGKRMDFG